MTFQSLSAYTTIILLLIISIYLIRHFWLGLGLKVAKKPDLALASHPPKPSMISKSLASALPDSVIFPRGAASFEQSMNSYWAQQECEVIPACVVRPRTVQELSTAVTLLKREYAESSNNSGDKLAIKGGVVIDLSLFCEVTPSEDGSSVIIGGGAKWMNVSKVLDERGLAVAGGRNSAVGVGGLTLGGGVSFFSPRIGLVCSNIISYEVVLASGSVTTASASENPDLWRALKGGSNNFGIVTRFTARGSPSTRIWSGFLYMPSFQSSKVLADFHESVERASLGDASTKPDNHATGPLACFSYIQALGLKIVSVNLVFATTTITNDPANIAAAHAAYCDAISPLRRVKAQGLVWTLVLQPFLQEWVRLGYANPMGLEDSNDPLVIVSFTVNWDESRNDEFVKATTRHTIEQIEAAAAANGTGHRFRYLNYCAEWQKPFEGYGKENWEFLQEVSRRYDPEGLSQRGCVGGFKLDLVDSEP
ncbi:FAD-binding domain-containing protein [Mytilinidion resinicola]|uniref:FAD-binding domain-containing protein n=1 Tax=Mytilinidion resinicola TaxID=574789 RepID=A0A6A6YA71_9PEZI|nr:FAD-binding domain-containing protein [Mytilinidion resinicola]KAF2804894.1 FAD-binding domain-containing protein [Mytilinidion resinicola]